MVNILKDTKITGTIGELLVQLRLLEYDIQAAPPLKDSGNDLIAIKGEIFKAIQVKTSRTDKFILGNLHEFHILALVHLISENTNILLDESKIYLLPKNEVNKITYIVEDLIEKEISMDRVNMLFK